MSVSNRILKNTSILYVRMAVTVFISLYATRLVLAALGIVDYGIFNVIAGAITMLTFLNGAMAGATQRFLSHAEGAGRKDLIKAIFNVSIFLHLVIAFLVVIVLEVSGQFLLNGILQIPPERAEATYVVYQVMIISTFLTIVSVPYDAILNAHENMFAIAMFSIVESVLKLFVALSLQALNFDKLILYSVLTVFTTIVLVSGRRYYCVKKYEECQVKLTKYNDRALLKRMASFAGWNFLGSISSITANYGQGIVINIFFSTSVNAAQGVANQVSGQLSAFSAVILKVINPIITKSEGAGDRTLMINTSLKGSKISFFALLFFSVPAIIEMPNILGFWLKTVPSFAIIFCRLLLIRNLVEQLYLPIVTVISAVGDIKLYQVTNSLLTLFPLVISYLLFFFGYPSFYMYYVFIVYSICDAALTVFFAKRIANLSFSLYLTGTLIPCFVGATLTFSVSWLTRQFVDIGSFNFLITLFTGFIAWLGCAALLGISKDERRFLIGKLTSLGKKSSYKSEAHV